MGGLDKLLERLRELMKEQKKRHQGGNKWIGTGGHFTLRGLRVQSGGHQDWAGGEQAQEGG